MTQTNPFAPIRDKRTEAQKRQQKLFQYLGVLARTKANLNSLLDTHSTIFPVYSQRLPILEAIDAINDLDRVARIAMTVLPNKKRKAQAEKDKPNVPF